MVNEILVVSRRGGTRGPISCWRLMELLFIEVIRRYATRFR
jgi:hypothetical protein